MDKFWLSLVLASLVSVSSVFAQSTPKDKHAVLTHAPHALLSGQTGGYMFWVYDPNTNGLYRENGFVYIADCNTVRTWVSVQLPAVIVPPVLPLTVSPTCTTDQGGED
jgi:hypothetical protein